MKLLINNIHSWRYDFARLKFCGSTRCFCIASCNQSINQSVERGAAARVHGVPQDGAVGVVDLDRLQGQSGPPTVGGQNLLVPIQPNI